MFGSRAPDGGPARTKRLFIISIIDFLKTNGFRIASHSYSRQPAPLASRNDIKPFLPLVSGGEDAPLEEVEEIRAIIGRGPYIELVALQKALRRAAQNCPGPLVEQRFGQAIEAVGLPGRHSGIVDQIE